MPTIPLQARTILCQTIPDGVLMSFPNHGQVVGMTPEEMVDRVVDEVKAAVGAIGKATCFVVDVTPGGEGQPVIVNSIKRYVIELSQDVETDIEEYVIEI